MVIDLKASTRRNTYLAGECIRVSISISNVLNRLSPLSNRATPNYDDYPKNINNNNLINTSTTQPAPPTAVDGSEVPRPERVAWISAYLHCECLVNRNKVAVKSISAALAPLKTALQQHNLHDFEANSHQTAFTDEKQDSFDHDSGFGNQSSNTPSQGQAQSIITPKTALGPDRDSHGIPVMQTAAQILCCDLTLKPGDEKKMIFEEKLPVDAPPSYMGTLLRYNYKLIISIQRVGGSIRQVKIPFRVFKILKIFLKLVKNFSNIILNSSIGYLWFIRLPRCGGGTDSDESIFRYYSKAALRPNQLHVEQ